MTYDLPRLIQKHRESGLLLDTNLLLLYVVGSADPRKIPVCKRTKTFTPADFSTLDKFVKLFPKLMATPNIFTEVTNLANQCAGQLPPIMSQLARAISVIGERYIPSAVAAQVPHFPRFGLADAAIISLVAAVGPLVLTDDFPLSNLLQSKGVDAINFNHLRVLGW